MRLMNTSSNQLSGEPTMMRVPKANTISYYDNNFFRDVYNTITRRVYRGGWSQKFTPSYPHEHFYKFPSYVVVQ